MTSDRAHVREASKPRHARAGGASTVQMITPSEGAKELLNGFTDIPPGSGIPLHYHNVEESVLVLAGHPDVEIDGQVTKAGPTDVLWIAAGLPHRFVNRSESEPVRIFWTYASADATRTLVETGQTARVAVEHGN